MPVDRWKPRPLDKPWLRFLVELDRALDSPATLHCVGGFALSTLVDMPRSTGDIDFIAVLPEDGRARLLKLGGEGSDLARKHYLHLQGIGIVDAPCNHESRLVDVTPREFTHLRLRVLDPYDLILTKAQRAATRDFEDARLLVGQLRLDRQTLWDRFEGELLPYLAVAPEKTELTVRLWLDELFA